MRLSCPNCQTEYEVPDAALTGRSRSLRCAICMTTWKAPALEIYREAPVAPEPVLDGPVPEMPAGTAVLEETQVISPPEPAVTAEAAAPEEGEEIQVPWAPEHERVSFSKASREKQIIVEPERSSKRGLQISVLIVVLIIVAVLVEHRQISNFWPPSLRLFNALGLR